MAKLSAIRDLDEETFRKFRAVSIEEKIKLGDAMTLAMKQWIKEKKYKKKHRPENLLKITGVIKTKNKVRWSEEVDEFLYGVKK